MKANDALRALGCFLSLQPTWWLTHSHIPAGLRDPGDTEARPLSPKAADMGVTACRHLECMSTGPSEVHNCLQS